MKYKRCCGAIKAARPLSSIERRDAYIKQIRERHEADERIRQRQQGRGKPIIATKFNDHQMVAVRNRVIWGKWRTFPDFLKDYLPNMLGLNWFNAERARAINDRHTILQWAEDFHNFQKANSVAEGELQSAPITGVVACYLMLAYNLYLIHHNVELQDRLIARLKDKSNFQGAYYELMVASILIRAGFELELVDETSRDSKHCEFSAASKTTGKKYWIEAKMKGVVGLMGKTDADGSPDPNPVSHLVKHLAGAIKKPAAGERMIFIDLNAEIPSETTADNPPAFLKAAESKMDGYAQVTLPKGESAYVFVTCSSFHRELSAPARLFAFPVGLGIPDYDFRKPLSLAEFYRKKQRHPDANAVWQSLSQYLHIPTTFDGGLPSEQFYGTSRVMIGSTYAFGEVVVGKVTTATVSEGEKSVYVGISTPDGKHLIGQFPMSDAELHDYRENKDEYFGVVRPAGRKVTTPLEMFEWLMESNVGISRQTMIDWFGVHRDKARLEALSDEDLRIEYCEALTLSIAAREQQSKAVQDVSQA